MESKTKLQVLYVEDDADSSELVSFILGLDNMEVTLRKTAEEAWLSAHTHKFDVILLDGMLEAGRSLNLCEDLHKFAPQTPIVFYSALAYTSDIENGMEAGAYEYLVKPYFGDLAATVRKATQNSKASIPLIDTATGSTEEVVINARPTLIRPLPGRTKLIENIAF